MTEAIEAFRDRAKAFLDANAERKRERAAFEWGVGSDDVSLVEDKTPEQEAADVAAAKAWAATRFEAGFGFIDGPVELGGAGLSTGHKAAYRALEAGYALPDQSIFTIGLGMVAPTVLAHGTPVVQEQYVAALHRGDALACQLFSEPGAGSDLASVSCRAERDGDEWVLTGQKVWTSNAHLADVGEAICRTDPSVPKHKGMTAFLVDMRAPGVEVRPLRQMSGGAGFNEVFLHEVRVPDSHRLGDVNGGWSVALTTLLNERASLGGGMGLGPGPGPFERLIGLLRHVGDGGSAVQRDHLARLYARHKAIEWTGRRAAVSMAGGGLPGPEMSILKLAGTVQLLDMCEFVSGVLGPRLLADTGEWGTFHWNGLVLGAPGGRLGGGTDEVLRNIIGERVLGLPKEPSNDSTLPFNELLRS